MRLIFDPEDGGDTSFRNVGLRTDLTSLLVSQEMAAFKEQSH
jgi:hypothetical protein